mmetsp:Transcript_10548/g.31128  ORF Transcript_10548/g.31128 Transcript_10548/m.31128 type:complete len:304 (+) Transcript_10548:423-1334(+)
MRRRVGPFVVQEKNAHIMSNTEEAVFDDFVKAHPEVDIKFSQYKQELPWYRKKAYRETCLDRIDLNFEWHREALKVALDVLSPLHAGPAADAEGEAETEAPQPDPLLKELAVVAATTSKSGFANTLVCSDCLGDNTEVACLDQTCHKCSFARLWSKGLRPKVLALNTNTNTESVRNSVSSLCEKQLSWDVVKSSDEGGDRNLRHTITGTITELLDSCEDVFRGWVPHRYHAVQAREAEIECDRTLTPGKLTPTGPRTVRLSSSCRCSPSTGLSSTTLYSSPSPPSSSLQRGRIERGPSMSRLR